MKNWEIHNLALPNWMTRLSSYIDVMELEALKNHLALHPEDAAAKTRLNALKDYIEKIAPSIGLAD